MALTVLALAIGACDRTPDRWNVLVLVPDTVRGDHLSGNGYRFETTPALDRLAAEGASFTQAITVAPRTWQSFASILTGLYPPHHGVRFINSHPLGPEIPTLATELLAAGYDTAAFDRIPFVRGITDGRGFAEIHDTKTASDRELIRIVADWIARDREAPFFAFVRLDGPHWPYQATAAELAPFDSCAGKDHSFNRHGYETFGVGPARRGRGMRLMDEEAYRKTFFDVDFGEEERRHRIAHYDAKLRRTDATLGWLIEQLRIGGVLEETIVVVTSDHGESFGENGYLQHGPKVDEPVLGVPLIVRLPAAHVAANPGATVEGQVRITDILPTLLEAVGLPAPEALDGISLVPAMRGEPLAETWAYAESGRDFVGASPEVFVEGVKGKQRTVRRAGWKLVMVPKPESSEYRLYDVGNDPGESTDLARRHPERVAELRRLLQPLLDADPDQEPEERELTDAEKEQLHRLGYL